MRCHALQGAYVPPKINPYLTMKKLAFKFNLNCKIAIYVPSTVDVDKPTDNSDMTRHVMLNMSEMFGGATSTPAMGGWKAATGELIVEDVTIVYSYCTPEQAGEHFERIIALCKQIKRAMRQEAVTLEYNNQIAFI